jgi:hypothetical protein
MDIQQSDLDMLAAWQAFQATQQPHPSLDHPSLSAEDSNFNIMHGQDVGWQTGSGDYSIPHHAQQEGIMGADPLNAAEPASGKTMNKRSECFLYDLPLS